MTCKRYGMLESHSTKQRNNVFKMLKIRFSTQCYITILCVFLNNEMSFFQRCVHIGIE